MLLTSLGERNFNNWKQFFLLHDEEITRTFLRNKSVPAFRSHFLLKLLQRARANIHYTSLSEARLQAVPPFWQTCRTSLEKLVKKRLILACYKKLLEWHGCKAAALGVRRLKSRGYLLSPRVWILRCAHKAKIWLVIGRKSLKKWSSVSMLVNVSDGWWLA